MRQAKEHIFGLGPGHLPQRAAKIAARHGATLVNFTDPQCQCGHGGHGCAPSKCKRHWFVCVNLGEPFNSRRARAVTEALALAKFVEI